MASIRLFLRRSAVAFEEVWSKAKVKYEEIHRHYDANTPAKMGVAVGKVADWLYKRRENQRLKEMLEKLRLEQEKLKEKLRAREEEKKNDKAGLQVLLPDSAVKDRNGMFAAVYPHGRRETIHQMNIQDHHRDAGFEVCYAAAAYNMCSLFWFIFISSKRREVLLLLLWRKRRESVIIIIVG